MNISKHAEATVFGITYQPRSNNIFILSLKMPLGFLSSPGQFLVLEPLSRASIMSRPFSIIGQSGRIVSVMIKIVGENTRLYSELKVGGKITVSGPKGTPIKIDKHRNYILIGGGIGAAALIFLAGKLKRSGKEPKILLGAKNLDDLAGTWLLKNMDIKTIVESGQGKKGYATDLLKPILKRDNGKSIVIACGPSQMLAKVAEMTEKYGNPCQVILEELMACGNGSCKGCAVFGKNRSVKHICSDGPAINASWVDWEKFAKKSCQSKHITGKIFPIHLGFRAVGKIRKDIGLKFNPAIINSSGCLGIEALESGAVDYNYLGALVTKGVTLEPKKGNKNPRVCETASGMINSIGLENPGIEEFKKKELPRWLDFGKPVIVNISGYSPDDYEQLAQELAPTPVSALEVNISCPNIKNGGMAFGTDPKMAALITAEVRLAAPEKFLIVKLSPNVTDIVAIAKAVVEAGADAISLVNTFLAMDINITTRRPKIGMVLGGLSGPAISPIALRMVYQLRKAELGVPIIGMGGIDSPETALKFFMAGANAVAIGSGAFARPKLAEEISRMLEKRIGDNGWKSIDNLVGSLLIN